MELRNVGLFLTLPVSEGFESILVYPLCHTHSIVHWHSFCPPPILSVCLSVCSVWNDHHHRTGNCVRHDRHVWRPFRDGCRDMPAHHHPGWFLVETYLCACWIPSAWIYSRFGSFVATHSVSVSSCLWPVWLFCCWMSSSRRATVLALVSHSSLPPTSVRQLSGRPSAPPLWTLAEVRRLHGNTTSHICFQLNNPTSASICPRDWVWGGNHCSLSPLGHSHW